MPKKEPAPEPRNERDAAIQERKAFVKRAREASDEGAECLARGDYAGAGKWFGRAAYAAGKVS